MKTTTAVVCLVAMVLFAAVFSFALYYKDSVKAGGRFKAGEFYIEATEQQQR